MHVYIAPSGYIQSPIVSIMTSSELNVTWLAPPLDQQNGIITHYVIKIVEVISSISFQYKSNTTWLFVGDLHPYYTYNITIAAVTIEQGPFLSGITITMPETGKSNGTKYIDLY